MGGSASLRVQGLEVRIGDIKLLHSLMLSLHPGQFCGLIGPSGAGKSTFIKVLLGIRPPSSGSVALGTQKPGDAGPVGYVPQDDTLHQSLTVEQSLDYAARLRMPGMDKLSRTTRITDVLQQLGIDDRRNLRIKSLSGGQRKRVSVALELLTAPNLLILDEPTSGLDPGLEARSMALFETLARDGRIIIVATHAMESLEKCTALLVLMAGQQAFFGPPRDALEFFRADRYADIFQQLPKQAPQAWARSWQQSPFFKYSAGVPIQDLQTAPPPESTFPLASAPALPSLEVATPSIPSSHEPNDVTKPKGATPDSSAAEVVPLKGATQGSSPSNSKPAPNLSPREKAQAELNALKAKLREGSTPGGAGG